MSGNGAKAAVQELCAQFERATGNTIKLHFEVNADLKKKIEAGEAFDVAVLNPPVIDALIKDGKLVAGSRADIGRSGLGLAVRKGAPKPDISSAEAFKRTLLAAKAVAYPGKGASGLYFVSLLDRLGIKAEMQGKLKPMAAEDTVEVVARGEADMVVVVATRITGVPGVDLVGPIPEDLQTKIGFAAGLSASAKERDAAQALIRFLTAPAAAATLQGKRRRADLSRLFRHSSCQRAGLGPMLASECRRNGGETYEKFRAGLRGAFGRIRDQLGRVGANQMGYADAVSRRQFPHPQHHAVRSRRRQGDQRLSQNRDPLGWLADQACRNQTQCPPRNHADR